MAKVLRALQSAGGVSNLLRDTAAEAARNPGARELTVHGVTLKEGGSFFGRALSHLTKPETIIGIGLGVAGARGLTPPPETNMLTTFTGAGSAGRSATPVIPTRNSGVLGTVIGAGVDYLRNRLAGPAPTETRCPDGSTRVAGRCLDIQPGGPVSGGGVVLNYGEAVMGRYGPALVPAEVTTRTARCPRGAVLGKDRLCYNKRDLRKSERLWNPGRKPLLTGGQMNAIAIANQAAGQVQRATSRLQSMGMLKKPKSRRQVELELRYAGKLRK